MKPVGDRGERTSQLVFELTQELIDVALRGAGTGQSRLE
jgi:hypothetical protein